MRWSQPLWFALCIAVPLCAPVSQAAMAAVATPAATAASTATAKPAPAAAPAASAAATTAAATSTAAPSVGAASCPAWLNQTMRLLRSDKSKNLCAAYGGRPLLIVNTASYCGFAPHFKGLEALYLKYKAQGLVVIGFPSDDFWQESKDEAKTAEVCYANYGVSFDMYAPIPVRGSNAAPLYKELARQGDGAPMWNFYKYLVNAKGQVVGTYSPKVPPESPVLQAAIEKVLREAAAQ